MAHLLSNHLEGNVLSTMRAFHRFTEYPKRLGIVKKGSLNERDSQGLAGAFLRTVVLACEGIPGEGWPNRVWASPTYMQLREIFSPNFKDTQSVVSGSRM